MRLQKFLAQAGLASRRRAEDLIAAGSVKVNGKVVTTLGTTINPGKDRVEVEGRRVLVEAPVYRLLLKPRACLATLAKSGERPDAGALREGRRAGLAGRGAAGFPGRGRRADHQRRRAGAGADEVGRRSR